MKLDTALVVFFACGLAACGSEQLQKRELPRLPQSELTPRTPIRNGNGTGQPPSACDEVADLDATCPGATLACPDETVGECILANEAAVSGWCAVESGGAICDGEVPGAAYEAWCRIQACYGEDYNQCLQDGIDECAPSPPTPPGVCAQIEAIAGACPGYGFDCPAYPVAQSQCFLDLLELMVQEVGGVCFMFDNADARCGGGAPSVEGFTSCATQECFAIDTYDSCMGNLEIVCSYLP